jgi:hypothetical protein
MISRNATIALRMIADRTYTTDFVVRDADVIIAVGELLGCKFIASNIDYTPGSGEQVWEVTSYGRQHLADIANAEAAAARDMVRVVVPLIVEIDATAWNFTFGTGTSRKAIVEDVRRYVLTSVQGLSAIADECSGTVTLK